MKTASDTIIKAFLNSVPEPRVVLEDLKRSLSTTTSKKGEAVIALLESTLGECDIAHAHDLAEKAYNEESDVNAHILFLLTWLRALLFSQQHWRIQEILLARASSLVSLSTPPEILAWVRYHQISINYAAGDMHKVDRLAEDFPPSSLSARSPHYPPLKLLSAWVNHLTGRGTLDDHEKLATLSRRCGVLYEKRYRLHRILDCVIRGALSEAAALVKGLSDCTWTDIIPAQTEFQVALRTLRVFSERQNFELQIPEHFVLNTELPGWVRSTQHLLSGEIDQALTWARAHTESLEPGRRTHIGLDEYALIRAELAAGNGQAALHLIAKRHEVGTWHYIDDLFLARCALISGDKIEAQRYFGRLSHCLEKYQAEGRLEIELELAKELKPMALVSLVQALGREPRAQQQAAAIKVGSSAQKEGADGQPIFVSKQGKLILKAIRELSAVDLPVLITGETGTGKELVARALHEDGPRRNKPFVAINCGALSDSLIESELFGHKRGAFTGADVTHEGLFREAADGTVFLDEIGDTSPRLQVALLRVLEAGEARPIGGDKTYKINCRIVAATNAQLSKLVEKGAFRLDLLHRLARLEISLPPLRERKEDILALTRYFLNVGREVEKVATISPELEGTFVAYSWPGNVRELRNVIERMRVLNSDKLFYDIGDCDLGRRLARQSNVGDPVGNPEDKQQLNTIARLEQRASTQDSSGITKLLETGTTTLRRLERLRRLFDNHNRLTTNEVSRILGVSSATAYRYLSGLCKERYIRRVTPSASSRTNYHEKNVE